MSKAEGYVAQARECFGTPWKIAVLHLKNLGYYDPILAVDLARGDQGAPLTDHATSLPPPGGLPLSLVAAFDEGSEVGIELTSAEADLAEAVPPYVAEARARVNTAVGERLREVLRQAAELCVQDRPTAAVDALAELLDEYLCASEYDAVKRALELIDATLFPPPVLTGILVVTLAAREKLGQARARYRTRALEELAG